MYAYASSGRTRTVDRPNVLFVMQGAHHLHLYRNVLRCCADVQWLCLIPKLPLDQLDALRRYHAAYGVKFFLDGLTTLAHYGNIDAVVTTWAVPHVAHLRQIRYIALAQELGIPTFEMQHGMFQLGLTYHEDGPFIGSSVPGALSALDTPNWVTDKLLWDGEAGIGYPPALSLPDSDKPAPPLGDAPVVFLTNLHWNLIPDAERGACYDIILETVARLPDQSFLIFPHPSETLHSQFKEMAAKFQAQNITNFTIVRDREQISLEHVLRTARLAVASVSTVLLDAEFANTPTVVFRTSTQRALLRALHRTTSFATADDLVEIIRDVTEAGYRPQLVTGRLHPFRPARLLDRLQAAIASRHRPSQREVVAAIARYTAATM